LGDDIASAIAVALRKTEQPKRHGQAERDRSRAL